MKNNKLLLISILIITLALLKSNVQSEEKTIGKKDKTAVPFLSEENNQIYLAFEAVATNPNAILVKVNDNAITQADLDKELTNFKKMLEENGNIKTQDIQQLLTTIKPQVLETLITKKLIDEACASKKITVSDAEIKKEIELIKTILPKNISLEDMLKKQNIQQTDFEKEIIEQLKIEKLIGVKEPTDEEIKESFEKNKEALSIPETVRARHILIKVEDTDTKEQKEAKYKKANEIRKSIKEGADFTKLARENSDCPSKANGGDLGEFARGDMVKPFEDVAFKLGTNEISDVVETEYGYHIIQTLAHNPPYTPSLNEVKGKIIIKLKMAQFQNKLATYLNELRDKAKIEYVSIPNPQFQDNNKQDFKEEKTEPKKPSVETNKTEIKEKDEPTPQSSTVYDL